MKKNSGLTILMYIIFFGIYSMVIFRFANEYNAVFWCNYIFMAIVYVISGVIAVRFGESVKEKQFMGVPLMLVSLVFVLFELVFSTIFMLRRSDVDVKINILLQTILLGAYVACIIVSVMRKNLIVSVEHNIKGNVQFIQGIVTDVEVLMGTCQDIELKKKLQKLCDVVKYSDPMSNSQVATVENKILDCIMELKSVSNYGNSEDAISIVDTLNQLFEERNKKIIATK